MSSKTNSAKKMISISKKINGSMVSKLIWTTVKFDILILILVAVMSWIMAMRITTGNYDFSGGRKIEYVKRTGVVYTFIQDESIQTVVFTTKELTTGGIVFGVLVLLQVLSIARYAYNNQFEINKKLKPVYDLARETEKITNLAYDEHYLQSLEDAIAHVNADMPDAKITTQNKELKGIEVALNNLLDRMRESYRQQSRFVSDASHELRTPIAVIRGYADMLDRWGKEDEGILEESIEAIKNESAHMQKLVEQLLFLARGDSGRNNLKLEQVNLKDLMTEVYEESVMIDENHIYDFSGEDAIIEGDVAMVKQSMRIFVDNASKYTTPGDTITLKAGHNTERAFFSVQDNGIGMKESDVVHIFERFYRSDEARNRKSGGTGLGLSIAKWIVDRHNGKINVLSRPELGTRITVYFTSVDLDHAENKTMEDLA